MKHIVIYAIAVVLLVPGIVFGELAPFVDPNLDPQHYIDRYNNESTYKEWFDKNYPEYSSIYQAVGLEEPKKTVPGTNPCEFPDSYCMEKYGMSNPEGYNSCVSHYVSQCEKDLSTTTCYDDAGHEWVLNKYPSTEKYPLIFELLQQGFGTRSELTSRILASDYRGTEQYDKECDLAYGDLLPIRIDEEKWRWMCMESGEFPFKEKLQEMYAISNVCRQAVSENFNEFDNNIEFNRNLLINQLKHGDELDEHSNCGSDSYQVNNKCVTKTLWNEFQDLHYLSENPDLPVCPSPYERVDEKCELKQLLCGTGTILKDGQCVVDTSQPKTEEKSSRGGGCLIATATYDSELAPQVQLLRELRDNQLLQTESGSQFMESFNQFYYSFSPIVADYERENPYFKEMVKIAITPMITSLSILNYVDMDSEVKVLGYGISLILLNFGIYLGIPGMVVIGIRKRKKK